MYQYSGNVERKAKADAPKSRATATPVQRATLRPFFSIGSIVIPTGDTFQREATHTTSASVPYGACSASPVAVTPRPPETVENLPIASLPSKTPPPPLTEESAPLAVLANPPLTEEFWPLAVLD